MAVSKSDFFEVLNNSGENIPAYSFAKIQPGYGYTELEGYFAIQKPDADNMRFAEIVIVPDAISTGARGFAYFNGIIFVVTKTSGETIAVGDKVGTDNGEWTAIKIGDDSYGNNDGQFLVLAIIGDDLLIRQRPFDNVGVFS